MAYIETVQRRNHTAYRVKWREGGGRFDPPQTETFYDDRARAERFEQLVELCGERMPSADQLRAHGFADLVDEDAPTVSGITLSEYFADYLVTLQDTRPETIADYRGLFTRYLAPYFAGRPDFADDPLMTDVSTRRVWREWQAWMTGPRGLSGTTTTNVRTAILAPLFARACQAGEDGEAPLLLFNPFNGLRTPRRVKNPREILRDESEMAQLIRGAYDVDMETGDAVMIMLGLALRWGEVYGLTVPAVWPGRRMVEIRKVNARDESGVYRLRDEPKSGDSWRTLRFGDTVAPVLARRLDAASGADRLMYAAPRGGVWQYNNWSTRRWEKVLKRAAAHGLTRRVTPHGLRASTITRLGDDRRVGMGAALQYFAGHDEITTTAIYTQPTDQGADAIAAAVDEFLGRVVAGTPAAA